MEEKVFSKILQKLRKEAGMTQENLASKLGVSPQAVSKWENGSYPEGDLLPRLADCFGVSIDTLYGRAEGKISVEQQVVNAVHKIWDDESLDHNGKIGEYGKLFKNILWALNIASFSAGKNYYEMPSFSEKEKMASAVINDSFYEYMNLTCGKEFCVYLKNQEAGEGLRVFLKDTEKVRKLFKMLSDKDCVDIISYMYSLSRLQFADVDAISASCKISKEKTEKVLEFLTQDLGLDSGNKPFESISLIGKDGKDRKAYAAHETFGGLLFILFAVADAYVHTPWGFSNMTDNKSGPYLKREE